LQYEAGVSGRILANLMKRPRAVLITILFGNTLVNVAASSLTERWLERLLPEQGLWVAIITMTIVLLVFGEITPKIIAVHYPEKIALMAARPVRFFSKIIFPVQIVLEKLSDILTPEYSAGKTGKGRIDFLALIDESYRENILKQSEYSVLKRILQMDSVVIADVMIPRTDIIALPDTIDFDEAVKAMLAFDFRRVPIYSGNLDNITGVLYAKDLLAGWLNPALRTSPKSLARSPFYVPGFISVKQLSNELSQKKCHLGIVLDEYGGTAGLVTHDDILRMIFKPDERDSEDANILQTLPDKSWVVNAKITCNVLEALLESEFDNLPFRTLNGYLLDQFGRIPEVGESADLHLKSGNTMKRWRLEILTIESLRIHTVLIKKMDSDEVDSE